MSVDCESTAETPGVPPVRGMDAFVVRDFLTRAAVATTVLLMLDYDGTLAPFVVDREQAFPYDGVRRALTAIAEDTDIRVVIVTGRDCDTVQRLLGIEPPPEIWGSHGLERLRHGQTTRLPLPESVTASLDRLAQELRGAVAADRVEEKPGCVAVHTRGLAPSKAERLLNCARENTRQFVDDTALQFKAFDGGIEVRSSLASKGHAVRTLLRESPSDAAIAYLGDDRTDEDAFAALGTHGLSILMRPEIRHSLADVWLCPPHDLLRFLGELHAVRTTGD